MIIRPYSQTDWAALCAIHDPARIDELKAANLEAAFLPLTIAAEREALFEYDVLVAEQNGKVKGFIAYDDAEIAWLYVHPNSYRQGIGKALIRHVLSESITPFNIELLKGNGRALQFYQTFGFKIKGTFTGDMPGNEAFKVTVYELSNAL
ncbi:GNAT family N-acetyltransferase [Thalassotalea euphylliae]|uniref:GNAT family N-acetyltransferase n=1 Tax=Thalassotalea euphylliae TaxID=1655234 RepID=UPI003643EE25